MSEEESSLSFEENDKFDQNSENISKSLEYSDLKEKQELSRKAELFYDKDVFKIHNYNFEDSDVKKSTENNSLKTVKNQIKLPSEVQRNKIPDDNAKLLHETIIKDNQVVSVQENKNKRKSGFFYVFFF